MSLQACWKKYTLDFAFEAVTSRERMLHKDTYLIRLWDDRQPDIVGKGECGLFRGLSADDIPDYEKRLDDICLNPEQWTECTLPSIHFGFEMAALDIANGGRCIYFDSKWIGGGTGIATNGLIWMGDRATMAERIEEKLTEGFHVLKLKIGGINFDDELTLIRDIRRRYSRTDLEIRLDANGSFTPDNAMSRLDQLAEYDIHSIEQPLRAGQPVQTAALCSSSPIPIALDEELIGWRDAQQAAQLLDEIKPQYIILKPTLIGGFAQADTYIREASLRGIGWWATSALESNIGLNAIAQWVAAKEVTIHQGLGTGMLYLNNIPSPLSMHGDRLYYNTH